VKEFEATVTPEALVNDPDPLGVWIRYIHWMRQENPSSSTASTELMERCGRAFSHDPRYKNDERLVKVGDYIPAYNQCASLLNKQ